MKLSKKWYINWIWPIYGEWFAWSITRFNGGGYLYGAAPYTYWRIGPIFIKRYV